MARSLGQNGLVAATAVWATVCVGSATASSADDKFKGAGLPLIFLVMYAAAIALTWRQLLAAHEASRHNPQLAWVFRAALLTSVVSIFIYFSAGWAYGLISSVICFFLAVVCASQAMQQQSQPIIVVMLLWFAVLIGLPDTYSAGIINTLGKTNCEHYYDSFSSTMCKDGWLVFVEIVATAQIGLTFLSLLALMALGVASDQTSRAPLAA